MLRWQHLQDDQCNFVVANHDQTDEFHAILGIISPSFFAEGKLQREDDIWLAIWKVNKALAAEKSIGTDLLKFVEATLSPRTISAIGINSQVAMLYKLMGFQVGHLSQHFVLNQNLADFQIACVEKEQDRESGVSIVPGSGPTSIRFREVSPDALPNYSSVLKQQLPRKSVNYVIGRYANHPKYLYKFYAVVQHGRTSAFFVVRKILVGTSSCLRIVDFFSADSVKQSLYSQFQELLVRENSEYIDFISAGIGDEAMRRLGFSECSDVSYVPHLFEPFSRDRAKIQFAFKTINSEGAFRVFKGDSDLDRPN